MRIDARWGLNAGDLRKFAAELVELAPDVIPTSALGGVAGSLIACHGVTEVSPHAIGRVARVQRPAIKADIRPKTTQLDEALRAVVTRFAERLERTEPELIDVAAVRFDVIADCRRGYNAALEAKLTKRMLQQLVLPDPSPAPRAVPSVPFCRAAANAHSTQPSWSPSKALQCERNLPSTPFGEVVDLVEHGVITAHANAGRHARSVMTKSSAYGTRCGQAYQHSDVQL